MKAESTDCRAVTSTTCLYDASCRPHFDFTIMHRVDIRLRQHLREGSGNPGSRQ